MAGSFNHVIEKPSGRLLSDVDICGMLECSSGDVAEAVEEMYGMIWYLAMVAPGDRPALAVIEDARQNYQQGLKWSPGRAPEGVLEDAYEGDYESAVQEVTVPTYVPPFRKFPLGTIVVCRTPYGTTRVGKIIGGMNTRDTQRVVHWLEAKKRWARSEVSYHSGMLRRPRIDELPEEIR